MQCPEEKNDPQVHNVLDNRRKSKTLPRSVEGRQLGQNRPVSYSARDFLETYNSSPESKTKTNESREITVEQISRLRICTKHAHHKIENFCVEHRELCCSECVSITHKNCSNVLKLEIASIGAFKSPEFAEVKKRLDVIIEKFRETINKERSKHEEIRSSGTGPSHSVMDRFGIFSGSNSPSSQRKMQKVNLSLLAKSEEHSKMFEFVEQNVSDLYAFLLIHSIRNIIDVLSKHLDDKWQTKENAIKNSKLSSIKKISLKRNKSTELELSIVSANHRKDVETFLNLDKIQTLPPMEFRRRSSASESEIYVGKFVEQEMTFLRDIDLSRVRFLSIYGMTFTEGNQLLLCDNNNSRILVCDENDTFLYTINTRYDPWDIDIIPYTGLAVTSSASNDEAVIQFIDIQKKCFSKEVKVKRSDQGGIASVYGNIFIGCENEIHILDQKGHKVRKLTGLSGGKVYHIVNCPNDRIILINGKDLLSITSDGIPDCSYGSPKISSPGKPASDSNGNMFIPDLLTHNIFKLTQDGSSITCILNKADGIYFPTAVAFNRTFTKLYVANKAGSSVRVFSVT